MQACTPRKIQKLSSVLLRSFLLFLMIHAFSAAAVSRDAAYPAKLTCYYDAAISEFGRRVLHISLIAAAKLAAIRIVICFLQFLHTAADGLYAVLSVFRTRAAESFRSIPIASGLPFWSPFTPEAFSPLFLRAVSLSMCRARNQRACNSPPRQDLHGRYNMLSPQRSRSPVSEMKFGVHLIRARNVRSPMQSGIIGRKRIRRVQAAIAFLCHAEGFKTLSLFGCEKAVFCQTITIWSLIGMSGPPKSYPSMHAKQRMTVFFIIAQYHITIILICQGFWRNSMKFQYNFFCKDTHNTAHISYFLFIVVNKWSKAMASSFQEVHSS